MFTVPFSWAVCSNVHFRVKKIPAILKNMRPSKLNVLRKRIHITKIIVRAMPLKTIFKEKKRGIQSALSSTCGWYILKQQNPMSMEVFQVTYGSSVAKIQQLETMGTNIREVFVTDMEI